LSVYLPELGLITDSSMAKTASLYFKELAGQVDAENTAALVAFMDKLKKNPVIMRFAIENPQIFQGYMNSPDVRDVLGELLRNLLGKARFDDVNVLDKAFEGIISFAPIFKDHLASLKEKGFFVQAIEMAEKLHMRDEITDELRIDAFRKVMEDLHKRPLNPNLQRVKKFAIKHQINSQNYPQIEERTAQQLEEIKKLNPEISHDLERLYTILQIQKREAVAVLPGLGKFFEPIYIFFAFFFKIFVRLLVAIVSRGGEDTKKAGKGT